VLLRDVSFRPVSSEPVECIQNWICHLLSQEKLADLLNRRFPLSSGDGELALQVETPIGLCVWRQDEALAFLGPVVVLRDKRRWGLGRQLVKRADMTLRSLGVRTVETTYPAGDPASERLFKACGFKCLGTEHTSGIEWVRVERILKKT
jgi:GNAT superfamily N-acetyltransferase